MDSLLADRPSLWIKGALALGLIALADLLVFEQPPGAGVGLLLLAFAAAAAVHPELRRSRLGLGALAVAALFALVQIEHPSFMAWLLFWTALGVAVLAARAKAQDGAWEWAQRLVVLGAKAVVGPLLDLHQLAGATRQGRGASLRSIPLTLALPLVGAIVFVWLFAVANPLIGDWFAAFSLPEPDIGRILFWGVAGVLAWGVLRPRFLRRTWALPVAQGELDLPGVSTASITLSLLVFNAIFALQNGLDVAFLWSGAALPKGMTLADYAHRGAYPLIATALLAGLFVLVFLRPGSETARRPLVRGLVTVWVVQNIFLVASTALRTVDYIEAYSLTRLRIAALIWMAVVAVGLALICWRLLRDKSPSWLINANVAVLAVVLTGCSVVDLGAVAASWNVRHAGDVGGRGAALDVSYLRSLNGAALVSLAELETRPLGPELRLQVASARRDIVLEIERRHSRWQGWTWRDARRLQRADTLMAQVPRPAPPLTYPANPR